MLPEVVLADFGEVTVTISKRRLRGHRAKPVSGGSAPPNYFLLLLGAPWTRAAWSATGLPDDDHDHAAC